MVCDLDLRIKEGKRLTVFGRCFEVVRYYSVPLGEEMKLRAHFGVLLTVAFVLASLTACTSTTTNSNVAQNYASSTDSGSSSAHDDAQIYMFTGGFNGIFSTGVHDMASELRKKGVPAKALSWTKKGSSQYAIKQAYKKNRARPIILAGHSFGADTALSIADGLTSAGIPVDLVIVFDPLGSATVPKGVKKFINYKASGSKKNPGSFKPGPGFNGKIVNVDIRTLPGLDRASHWNIVNQQNLQKRVVDEIAATYRRG